MWAVKPETKMYAWSPRWRSSCLSSPAWCFDKRLSVWFLPFCYLSLIKSDPDKCLDRTAEWGPSSSQINVTPDKLGWTLCSDIWPQTAGAIEQNRTENVFRCDASTHVCSSSTSKSFRIIWKHVCSVTSMLGPTVKHTHTSKRDFFFTTNKKVIRKHVETWTNLTGITWSAL